MLMNMEIVALKNIAEFFAKRIKEDRHVIHCVHAATLKNERIRSNLTLEDITAGICSKSYLSKIENNLLSPDPCVMRLLFERVNIDYDKLLLYDRIIDLSECMNYYLYQQNDKIEMIYQSLDNDFFIARDSLIKILYYLTKHNFQAFAQEISYLDDVKSSLNDYELLMLMFCTIEFYILNYQFNNANKYLDIIRSMPIEDNTLRSLFYQQRLIAACNLHNYVYIYKYYEKLRNEFQLGYPVKQQFYIKLLFLEAFSDNFDTLKELENMENDYIPEEYHDDYYYSKCLIMIKSGKYQDVIELLLKKKLFSPAFIALYSYCLKALKGLDRYIDELKTYEEQFFTLNKSMHYDENDAIHLSFIKLMIMYLRNTKEYEIFDYMKNYLIINLPLYQHRFYSLYYANSYYHLLGRHSRYKDAYNFYLQNADLLKNNLYNLH